MRRLSAAGTWRSLLLTDGSDGVVAEETSAADWSAGVTHWQAAGWQPALCGMCGHWQPDAGTSVVVQTGQCRWRINASMPEVSADAARQLALAYPCDHWSPADGLPLRDGDGPGDRDAAEPSGLAEQSGKAPGTRPCPTCSGRIANLGSVTTVTAEDDARALSLWRCRQCLAWFMEDWVDAWVRTETLQTTERLYRLAPAEAMAVAAQIARCPYPSLQARRTPSPEKVWLAQFVDSRTPLRATIRKG